MNKELNPSSIFDILSKETIGAFKLTDKELKIIEFLLSNLLEGRDSAKAYDLLAKTEGRQFSAFKSYKHISRLIQAGILEAINLASEHPLEILYTRIKLSNNFLSLCFEGTEENESDISPYSDNHEYLSDQIKRIDLIYEINEYSFLKSGSGSSTSSIGKMRLAALEKRISQRLEKTERVFPLEQFKKHKGLNCFEELAVVAVLKREMINAEHFEAQELFGLIEQYPFETKVDMRTSKDRLLKKNILEVRLNNHTNTINLTEKVKKALLGDIHIPNRRAVDKFFEIKKSSVSLFDVILHAETQEEINLVCHKIKGEVARKLKKWGVLRNFQHKSSNQNATILFYGSPGTGKTLTAYAVAAHLKKELLIFDCSRVLGMWVGQSEKGTRMIFDEYRRIFKGQRNPPVLLLNEADQFLHKRIEATRSTDHMYNQMQNIFLEQMENFEGVLIATTNLPGSMDSAFSRRFDHKIEFKRPGPEERLKLCQVHIPEKVPLDGSIDLWELATRYEFSGGQISLIVRNALARAAQNGDRLTQDDLIWACTAELAGNFDAGVRIPIGF